jgi:hypothetical protein
MLAAPRLEGQPEEWENGRKNIATGLMWVKETQVGTEEVGAVEQLYSREL